jgi:acid phosphatase
MRIGWAESGWRRKATYAEGALGVIDLTAPGRHRRPADWSYMRRVIVLLAFACTLFAQTETADGTARPSSSTIPNIADVVNQLVRYHDVGQYDFEIRQVAEAARTYVEGRVKDAKKEERLAAVFDIDETSLSNWEAMADCGFCALKVRGRLYPNVRGTAIVPVLELYNFLRTKGVKVFFVTGRGEGARDATVKNLKDVGYAEWEDLLMRPNGNTEPAQVFKPKGRQSIVNKGFTIIMNIGDQASDLAGCCAERSFKLPNPFYLIP